LNDNPENARTSHRLANPDDASLLNNNNNKLSPLATNVSTSVVEFRVQEKRKSKLTTVSGLTSEHSIKKRGRGLAAAGRVCQLGNGGTFIKVQGIPDRSSISILEPTIDSIEEKRPEQMDATWDRCNHDEDNEEELEIRDDDSANVFDETSHARQFCEVNNTATTVMPASHRSNLSLHFVSVPSKGF